MGSPIDKPKTDLTGPREQHYSTSFAHQNVLDAAKSCLLKYTTNTGLIKPLQFEIQTRNNVWVYSLPPNFYSRIERNRNEIDRS